MKNIPFFNEAPNCLMNCAVMAMLYFSPWNSPDEKGETWSNPFHKQGWMKSFCDKLGISTNPDNNIGLDKVICAEFLIKNDLSASVFSSENKGYKKDKLYLDSLGWYDEMPGVIVAAVEYGQLIKGEYGPHAVVICGFTDDEIIYHDPALSNGAYQRCPREKFFHALRMYNFGFSSWFSLNNMMIVWDQDTVPDLVTRIKDIKNGPHRHTATSQRIVHHKSHFSLYKSPLHFLKRLNSKLKPHSSFSKYKTHSKTKSKKPDTISSFFLNDGNKIKV